MQFPVHDTLQTKELHRILMNAGGHCFLRDLDRDGYSPLSDGSSIICVESGSADCPLPDRSGICFVLRRGPGLQLVTTFNNVTWQMRRRGQVLEFVRDMMSGEYCPKGVVPVDIPVTLQRKFGMALRSTFQLWPDCSLTGLYDDESESTWDYRREVEELPCNFTRDTFLIAVTPWVDSIRLGRHALVYIRKGNVRMTIRFEPGRRTQSVAFLLNCWEYEESDEHMAFLAELRLRCGGALFSIDAGGERVVNI